MTPQQEHPLRLYTSPPLAEPVRHVLMTLDAVGGVWRYALDLATQLKAQRYRFTFVGLGPEPSAAQRLEAERVGELLWLDAPLDWLVEDERALDVLPPRLAAIVAERDIDLVQLNLPSQAAGLFLPVPVVVVSHSCVVTWFGAVRGTAVPDEWAWQQRRNRAGFDNADLVVAPSHAHAEMLDTSYGRIAQLRVVHNGSRPAPGSVQKENFVFAAGRWWDEGKNGAVLDRAAPDVDWPIVMAGTNCGPAGQFIPLERVDHTGQLAHAEVRALMAKAAIVCSPSIYEPFGLAPLEAASAGAALILSDIPTYRELWDDAALFAPPHDPAAFAEAINSLARDPDRRSVLAQAANRRAQCFGLEAQARSMDDAYQTLLTHTNAARSA